MDPSRLSIGNDDHISKTTILITVNSRSTYKTLLVKESHVDYTYTSSFHSIL